MGQKFWGPKRGTILDQASAPCMWLGKAEKVAILWFSRKRKVESSMSSDCFMTAWTWPGMFRRPTIKLGNSGTVVIPGNSGNSGTVYLSLGGASGRQSADCCSRSTWLGGSPPHGQFKSPDESGSYSVIWRVRVGVRRRFACATRHRCRRSTDRYALSLRRYRLRGVVFSQGCEGADPHRRRCGHRPARADRG
jgi:hypothetical protein